MFDFPVVPLCDKQLKDINPEDIISEGLFRLCNVYKGGGGYDKFPAIALKRLGIKTNYQFVVQLKGCPLKCSYCYVTPDGINGKAVPISTEGMHLVFNALTVSTGIKVFHLMGGAPALYIEHWNEIIDGLPTDTVFHSDLMLIEKEYDPEILKRIAQPNCLYALSIKGNDADEFEDKTGVQLKEELFWSNFDKVVDSGLNFYITFTDMNPSIIRAQIKARYGSEVLEDSFTIDKVDYEALGII